jgi:hypothetical protein
LYRQKGDAIFFSPKKIWVTDSSKHELFTARNVTCSKWTCRRRRRRARTLVTCRLWRTRVQYQPETDLVAAQEVRPRPRSLVMLKEQQQELLERALMSPPGTVQGRREGRRWGRKRHNYVLTIA